MPLYASLSVSLSLCLICAYSRAQSVYIIMFVYVWGSQLRSKRLGEDGCQGLLFECGGWLCGCGSIPRALGEHSVNDCSLVQYSSPVGMSPTHFWDG